MSEPIGAAAHPAKENVKETIISVIIAFAMAFVFRSFVAEAFIIPTGSMAPTLNGAHMRFVSPTTGRDWAVAPWHFIDGNNQAPYPNQAVRHGSVTNSASEIVVHDPMTGAAVSDREGKARPGDRIFVLKYLFGVQEPEPFDVVVFKNPTNPDENYIKRLIALPGEQVAIVDGDVFVRPAPAQGGAAGDNPWAEAGWSIRRKPGGAQRAVWQPVFDSGVMSALTAGVASPWSVSGGELRGGGSMVVTTGPAAVVAWDQTRGFVRPIGRYGEHDRTREINDRYAYNQSPDVRASRAHFPVGDVAISAVVSVPGEGAGAGGGGSGAATVRGVIEARKHRFVVEVGERARITMVPLAGGEPRVLAEGDAAVRFVAGSTHSLRVEHVDQAVRLIIDGKVVLEGTYGWSPMERLSNALIAGAMEGVLRPTPGTLNVLSDPASYERTTVRWEVDRAGGGVELRRIGLDRDLYYQASDYRAGRNQRELAGTPGAATHPRTTLTLKSDQYFVCGDNSPSSLDGRLWGYPDPWVAEQFDGSPAVVSRRLMMGKAFFVYFPAPVGGNPVGVPDFGRLRMVR